MHVCFLFVCLYLCLYQEVFDPSSVKNVIYYYFLYLMHVLTRSEETGFPVRGLPKSTRWPQLFFFFIFLFLFDFKNDLPIKAIGFCECLCVSVMKCQIFYTAPYSVAKNYSYILPIIWFFWVILLFFLSVWFTYQTCLL